MPVKDSATANRIVTTITASDGDDLHWTHREKENVHYYSSSSGLPFLSFSPTIGLSDRVLVVGPESGSVEAAIKRAASGSSELGATRNFQNAERAVPTAQQAFVYLDPALIYARFDASLRPLLAMGAAFLPALAETIDVSKLPSAEVVARHLGPTVMSQSYRGDGYVAESVGSIPFYQTVIGTIAIGAVAGGIPRHQTQPAVSLTPPINRTPPRLMPPSAPSPRPTGSP
jgi:hypothetical protein